MDTHYLKNYLNSHDDFSGWEEINIFYGDTLSDAWVSARPDESNKFEDDEFRAYVDSSNGKWLEKRTPDEQYKIILATDGRTEQEVMSSAIHEIRHVLDYKNGTKDLRFSQYHPGTEYFTAYSEFNAVRTQMIFDLECILPDDKYGRFRVMSEQLGYWTADSLHGILTSQESSSVQYFISRYLGAHSGIDHFNDRISPVFHLWTLTPVEIIEQFGDIFYLGNEWEKMSCCSVEESGTQRWKDLLERIESYVR